MSNPEPVPASDDRTALERRLEELADDIQGGGSGWGAETTREAAAHMAEQRRALELADQMRRQVAGGTGSLTWRGVWDAIGSVLAKGRS